jgi:hypothetical protein
MAAVARTVDYAWLESRALRISSFDTLVIPGLFQTPAYMQAVIRARALDPLNRSPGGWRSDEPGRRS